MSYISKKVSKFSNEELTAIASGKSTWHKDYKNSAYIIVTNLDKRIKECDLSVIFSQYGEITDIYLVT